MTSTVAATGQVAGLLFRAVCSYYQQQYQWQSIPTHKLTPLQRQTTTAAIIN